MPTIIACPHCGGKLRVSDELQGQLVRCPKCDRTFDTARTAEPPAPVPQDLPLELAADEPPSGPRPAPTGGAPGPVGAVELKDLKLSLDDDPPPPPRASEAPPLEPPKPSAPPRLADEHDDLKACPACGRHSHRDATRCSHCGERFGGRGPESIRHRGPRRDSEPDRGTVVLTLGILSVVGIMVCAPVGVVLGLTAWIMGQADLRKMRKGDMDPNGQGTTQAGWICGIVGTVLSGLVSLFCVGYFTLIFVFVNSVNTSTTFRSPPPPVQQWPPPQNKPVKKMR